MYAKNMLELTAEDFANFKNLLSHIRYNTPLAEPVYPMEDSNTANVEAEVVEEGK